MRETWVRSLGWEDPLEKGKATHSSILAWRIPWTTVHGVIKSRTRLSDFHFPSWTSLPLPTLSHPSPKYEGSSCSSIPEKQPNQKVGRRPKQTFFSKEDMLLLLLSLQSCPTLCDPIDGSHQAPLSLGFSRQEHWSGLPFPPPVGESESEVTQSCPTLSDPMDCSLPGSSIHGIFQARVLEWGATAFSERRHTDN